MNGLLRLWRSAFIVLCRIIICLRLPALCEESPPAASLLPASVKKVLPPRLACPLWRESSCRLPLACLCEESPSASSASLALCEKSPATAFAPVPTGKCEIVYIFLSLQARFYFVLHYIGENKLNDDMKTFQKLLLLTAVAATASCNKIDKGYENTYYPNMLVTVKTNEQGKNYLQLDDKTTLLPVNVNKTLFGGKQVRALANCTEVKQNSAPYNKAVRINWIDSVLTKKPVATLGEDNDKKYGKDPLEIVDNWVTILEDNYITLCFNAVWGPGRIVHTINLVKGTNPYELELRHNANGDVSEGQGGRMGTGIVAFDLRELPKTGTETVKLIIKYKSFRMDKTVQFDYCTDKTTKVALSLPDDLKVATPLR